MRGYLRVFLRSLEAAVASWTEYRLDFLAALLTSLLEAVGRVVAALALFLGLLIAYLSAFALALVGFFSVYVHNLVNLISGVFGAGQYPLRAYAAPVRVLLTFVLPVYLAVNLPAEVFLGAVGPGALWAMGAFLVLLWGLVGWLFFLGLRAYTSASS